MLSFGAGGREWRGGADLLLAGLVALALWALGSAGYAQSSIEDEGVIQSIIVDGNERIEDDTVASYLLIAPGDPFDPQQIDISLKALFRTGLFADVTLEQRGADLVVKVRENPIVNRVIFEGNKRIKEDKFTEDLQLAPRVVYTRAKVQSDVSRIIEQYRRKGHFAAHVDPKVAPLDQNRVDLVFEIEEGPRTGIAKINFTGNKLYADQRLRNVIVTQESKWWKFWTANANYDPDRLEFDQEQLRQFYRRNGYADFRVASAIAELTPDRSDFFITVDVDEGVQYEFGKIAVKTDIDKLNPDFLVGSLPVREGEIFNGDLIEDSVDSLTFAAGVLGFAFVDIRPDIERDRQNRRVNITFEIEEGPRVYVERINVIGNVRTIDKVIRREMRISEGDAFNRVLLDRSRVRIRSLGYFGDVTVEERPGSAPDRTVVDVSVEEQATGAFSIGAGFSSADNFIADLSVEERNLLGRGQFLRFRVSASSRTQQVDIRFTEPYFFDRNLALGFEVFSTRTSFRESFFESENIGMGLLFGFPLSEYARMNARYQLISEDTTIKREAPVTANGQTIGRAINCFTDARGSIFISNLCDNQGQRLTSSIGYTLTYDRRDDPINPRRGFNLSLSQDFAGLGGDVQFLRNEGSASYFYPIYKGFVGMLRGQGGYVTAWGSDELRLNDRFFRGGSSFRGFEVAGVGAREFNVSGSAIPVRADDPATPEEEFIFIPVGTSDALGGHLYAIGTAEIFFPLPVPDEYQIKASMFVDVGTVGDIGLDASDILEIRRDSNGRLASGTFDNLGLRLSAGFSVRWNSPFGPIQIDLAEVFIREDYDRTEGFRFSGGTRF